MRMKLAAYVICLSLLFASCKDASQKTDDTSTTNESVPETSAALGWVQKFAGVNWVDNREPDHTLIFNTPTTKEGIVTGEMEEHFPGLVNKCTYERISDSVLNIHVFKTIRDGVEEPRTGTTNLTLQLTDEGNTLIINYPDGRILSYKRTQLTNSPKETIANTATASNTKLWLDKIAAGDWKNVMNNQKLKFNTPLQDGNIIKGEMELHEESFTQVFKYEKTTDGEMKCRLIRFKIKGDENFTEETGSGNGFDVSFKTELLDDGSTFVLHHANGKIDRYKH